jgi:hypothetical protein
MLEIPIIWCQLFAENLLQLQSNEVIFTQESKHLRNKIKREMKYSLIHEHVGDVVQGAKGFSQWSILFFHVNSIKNPGIKNIK